MLSFLLLAGVLANQAPAPLRVQVVARGGGALAQTAEGLRKALGQEARLRVGEAVLLPREPATTREADIEQALAGLDAAEQHYTRLEPQAALTLTADATERLRLWLDGDAGRPALARARRVRGLTLLFLQKPADATRSFASASFLDPEFSPAAEEWPPEARLAYADSVAATRRLADGALSVRVTPEAAGVWLDGRQIGIGSTTAPEVEPGEHFLLVTCPGYQRFAGVVEVGGAGKLSQASVYLEPEDDAESLAAGTLVRAVGSAHESTVARQVATVLDVDLILLVAPGFSDRDEAKPVLRLFRPDGTTHGDPMAIGSVGATADAIVARLFSVGEPIVEPAAAWHQEWWVWAAAGGGAALVGGTILAIALTRDNPDRVTFVIGRGGQ